MRTKNQRSIKNWLGFAGVLGVILLFLKSIFEVILALQESKPQPFFTQIQRLSVVACFVFFCLALTSGLVWLIWKPAFFNNIRLKLIRTRRRMGWLRFVLAALFLLGLLRVLQFSHLGTQFTPDYLRWIILTGSGLVLGGLLSSDIERLLTTSSLACGFLLLASAFTLSNALVNVVDYPFSLTWSEGNRFWDYSLLFGRQRYLIPPAQEPSAFIDQGRQFLWGLAFLLPGLTIWQMRLWNAFLLTVPYAVLGWIVFRGVKGRPELRLLAGLWCMAFLAQGPIYTPLILSACLVGLAWLAPFWVSLPLVALAGYYANISRFTWMFAPALWGGMIALGDTNLHPNGSRRWVYLAATAFILAGLIGGVILPNRLDVGKQFGEFFQPLQEDSATPVLSEPITADEISLAVGSGEVITNSDQAPDKNGKASIFSLAGISQRLTSQPLLWQRLLPNPTFGPGILLALFTAAGPLIILCLYLYKTGAWKLNRLGLIAILTPMVAFLVVGLVISTKIGGGSNLHNLDLFLVGLVFVAALAWKAGGSDFFEHLNSSRPWIQAWVVLMMFLLSYKPLMNALPLDLPEAPEIEKALKRIHRYTADALPQGDILFIDQRQLLTFGKITDVPLVSDYEKKYLMEQAMSDNQSYFSSFYQDLANKRFSLIIVSPQFMKTKGDQYSFGEENDAWVKWVSRALLCYYKSYDIQLKVKIKFLIPRNSPQNCPR